MSNLHVITVTMRSETPAERRKFANDEKRLNADIGKLVRHWALLHDSFASIFHSIVAQPEETVFRPSVGHSIWHSIKSDLLQRQILQAAIGAKIELRQRYNWPDDQTTEIKRLQEYVWLLKETTKKSDARNDFVHAPIIFHLGYFAEEHEAEVSDLSSDPRSEKLKSKDLYQYCAYCLDFCEKASAYLHAISHYRDTSQPFPERPRWLPVSHFPTRTQQPRRKRRQKMYRVAGVASKSD